MTTINVSHKGQNFQLVIARRPITLEFLYRVCQGAYNISLFEYVRNNQGDEDSPYHIEGLRDFCLTALSPDQDILVSPSPGESLLFSDFLVPLIGYKPELWTPEQVFELFLSQTA
jgi:hypothetical protein